MKEEKINIYRVLSIAGIFLCLVSTAGGLCFINQMKIEQVLCIVFIILGIMPVLIFELVHERHSANIGNNIQTTYARVAIGVLICCAILFAISFLPEFYRPILLIVLIMSAFSNSQICMTIMVFYLTLLTLTTGGSFFELLTYIILTVIGISFAKALTRSDYRPLISIIFFFVSVLFPSLFYYLANDEIVMTNFIYCLFNGALVVLYSVLFYPKEKTLTEEEVPQVYAHLLEEDYVQIREVRAYSMAEYRHARKVSDIAFKYATVLNMDAQLAAAAGFYYRLGRWEGEPVVEAGVKKAEQLCFPQPLIQVLKEYNGEEALPSTKESALIHIIDAVLIKVELLEKEVGASQWNREVLIHQTLNELSTAGLYDKSGLSINAFIKIREWLAKEDL